MKMHTIGWMALVLGGCTPAVTLDDEARPVDDLADAPADGPALIMAPEHLPLPVSMRDATSVCWTLEVHEDGARLLAVDVDTNAVEPVATFPNTPMRRTGSLGYDGQGTLLGISEGDARVFQLHVATGTVTEGATLGDAGSITWTGERWITPEARYHTLADVMDDVRAPWADSYRARVIQAHDGIVYSVRNSTDHLDRRDLATDIALEPLMLQGYDGSVRGIGVTDDHVHILTDPMIRRFTHTGEPAGEAWVDWTEYGSTSGLWCF
jgi:hypothetical protein